MSLENGNFQTTFSRLKAAWGKGLRESFQEYGNWKSTWIEDDQVLEFARHGKKSPQRLKMTDLQQQVKDLVYGLQPALEKLLPEGMSLPPSQVHRFEDTIHREGEFFMDSSNSQNIIHPLYQDFKNGHTVIPLSPSFATTWLQKEQEFLGHLLAVLLISGGVSPRTNFAQVCCIRGVNRNIFHISDSPVWISLSSKANSAAQSGGGLWAFPSQVAWPLYFYLGVIRPFSIHLLHHLDDQPSLDILKDYLFVHILPSKSIQRLWSRKDTKKVVEELIASPLGLKMDAFDLRQILQAVANRQLQDFDGIICLYIITSGIVLTNSL